MKYSSRFRVRVRLEVHDFLNKAEKRDINIAVESPRVVHIYKKKKK